MNDQHRSNQFDASVRPYLAAAYNLARWIVGNPADAQDVVQEAMLRAFRFFDDFRGDNLRAWLLKIVRNTALSSRAGNWARARVSLQPELFETAASSDARWCVGPEHAGDPAQLSIAAEECAALRMAVAALATEFREVLVLREFEDLSYREIAAVTGIPIGTVMSRLSRARDELTRVMRDQPGVTS